MRPDGEMVLYGHPAPLEQFPDAVSFFRENYKGVLIGNQAYTPESASQNISSKLVDLVSFARLHIVNPDLTERITNGWPVENKQDLKTWFTGGANGYTSYPRYTPK